MNAITKIPPQLSFIAVTQLRVSPDNIRKKKTTKREDEELRASIRAQGVVQPLIVKPTADGTYDVHCGGRRLEQTKVLISEKALLDNHELACVVLHSDATATEISLIENTMRAEMHPVDQYEAFSRLHEADKLSIDEIALHFGRSKKNIQQLLALGGVHPTLRQLCRDGKIHVDILSAYTSSSDQEKQLSAYHALAKKGNWAPNSSQEVRSFLTNDFYTDSHKLVQFFTLKTYKARGGKTSSDLFEKTIYLHDTALVEEIAKEKLQAEHDALVYDWRWVEINLDFSIHNNHGMRRLQPTLALSPASEILIKTKHDQIAEIEKQISEIEEKDADQLTDEERESEGKKLDELEQKKESLHQEIYDIEEDSKQFSDEQRALSGCMITIGHAGKLDIFKGLVRKEDEPKKAKGKTGAPDGDDSAQELAEEDPGYSQSLALDLSAWHLSASKTELLYNSTLMYQAMQFCICWDFFGDHIASWDKETPLHFTMNKSAAFVESSKADIEPSRMHQEIEEARERLNLTWLRDTATESFRQFQELSDNDVMRLLAYSATYTLKAKGFKRSGKDNFIDELLLQSEARLAKHWRPTADAFFSRCSRPMLDEIGTEILGDDYAEVKKQKRPLICGRLEIETASSTNTIHDCWMPPGFLYHNKEEE